MEYAMAWRKGNSGASPTCVPAVNSMQFVISVRCVLEKENKGLLLTLLAVAVLGGVTLITNAILLWTHQVRVLWMHQVRVLGTHQVRVLGTHQVRVCRRCRWSRWRGAPFPARSGPQSRGAPTEGSESPTLAGTSQHLRICDTCVTAQLVQLVSTELLQAIFKICSKDWEEK